LSGFRVNQAVEFATPFATIHGRIVAEFARMETPFKTLLLLVLGAVGASASQEQPPIREQTLFRESEPFQHAVPLPQNVLQVLLRTREVKESLDSASAEQKSNLSQLFLATEVHLSGLDKIDFIVRGITPVTGADNDWFWVVNHLPSAPRVVLWAGCDSLEVLDGRTNGFKNIRCSWSSPSLTITSDYHFNGQKYLLWKRRQVKNPG